MPTVEVNGVETYYERHGEGHPIVCAHGLGMDHRWWEPQVDGLSDEYELVIYDIRGHGQTSDSDRTQYSMKLLADDLYALVDTLDLETPVICGHSLGGMFAQTYAVRYPAALAALIIVDAQVDVRFTRQQQFISRVGMPLSKLVTRTLGRERATRLSQLIMKPFVDDSDSDTEDEVEAYVEDANEMISDRELIKFTDAVRGFRGVDGSAITVPTLLAYGGEVEFMRKNANKLEAEIPTVTRRDYPDDGHGLSSTAAEEFNEDVRAFLENSLNDESQFSGPNST